MHIILGEQNKTFTLYREANEKIEKRTNTILNIMLRILIPCYVSPNMILSYYKYFTSDLTDDTFRLFIPSS